MIDKETHESPVITNKGKRKKATSRSLPRKPVKLKADMNAEDGTAVWKALNWNKVGGKEAKQYPFVITRKLANAQSASSLQDEEEIQCLAGETGRLLRFMSESAAQRRANQMNYATLFSRSQVQLF